MDRRRALSAAVTATAVIIADQGSKTLVRETLALCSVPPVRLCDRVDLVGPLGILRTANADGAFAVMDGSVLWPVLVATLLVFGLALRRATMSGLLAGAVGLLVGGIVANLVDRALYGAVTDFIDLAWGNADDGLVLNPADLALAIGGGLWWIGVFSAATSRRVSRTYRERPAVRLASQPRRRVLQRRIEFGEARVEHPLQSVGEAPMLLVGGLSESPPRCVDLGALPLDVGLQPSVGRSQARGAADRVEDRGIPQPSPCVHKHRHAPPVAVDRRRHAVALDDRGHRLAGRIDVPILLGEPVADLQGGIVHD